MTAHETAATIDARGTWLLGTGGVAALVLVAGYLATFPLYALVGGPPPSGTEAHLAHYARHLPGWWGILGLMVFTDLLYLVVGLALFQALRGIHGGLMILALACKVLFVFLDLAVTWTNHAALFVLGSQYAAAATEAERAASLAAAGFAGAVMDSPLPGIYAILIPAIGIFLASLVMLKGIFNKSTAILGLAVGLSGVVAVAGPYVSKALDFAHVVNALLATAWFFLVGVRLYRLRRV